ncbi:hypothetical protein [Conexibacter arvalis]|uniref:Uncharacterized protein n=1 Tax=Conexibacter arvalis TaxID=912552 RepID=A0A840IJR4_9ACTN|nr:hypothetical protein [Conexibacter arvalis]MBB4664264.1 hypothetical protein [Conexibacter arvalis]
MLSDGTHYDVGATLRWVEIAERLRAAEVTLLHCLALVRGIDPDLSATSAITVAEAQVDELRGAVAELGDRVEQIGALTDRTRRGSFELRLRTLQLEAEAALSAGVADVERAEVLARCLPVHSGFPALAATLRCTDAHESWGGAPIGHLLGCFRDADLHLVRHVTGLATLSPEARWDQCDREQLGRLALVLERHAAAAR